MSVVIAEPRRAARDHHRQPSLPPARGPITAALFPRLRAAPAGVLELPDRDDDPVWGDDPALALYCCYELHYRGFRDVDARWEWDPSLLAARATLERRFEADLRATLPVHDEELTVDDVLCVLDALANASGPSLSSYMEARGSVRDAREFAVHRSAYQLKEADPHTWAIPRLAGPAKSALVAVQQDEYGQGVPGRLHSDLFAATMRSLGLDDAYGSYLHALPGSTLATVNLMSYFGLHRRLRGALVGHLALFEMTSVTPMARYARTLRRLGVDLGTEFFDVHADVDGEHELVARTLCRSALADEPALAHDVAFGAEALDLVERRFAGHLLDQWRAGRTSLLDAAPRPSP